MIEAFDVVVAAVFVVVTVTLLFFTPDVVPCTLSEMVHDEFGATPAPDRPTLPEPATAGGPS